MRAQILQTSFTTIPARLHICNTVKKSTRRIARDPEPVRASPTGFGFGMDAFTFSVPNIDGERHAYIMGPIDKSFRKYALRGVFKYELLVFFWGGSYFIL